MAVPLPWERLLWTGRPALLVRLTRTQPPGVRYALTDYRLVSVHDGVGGAPDSEEDIALDDIGDVTTSRSRIDRLSGTFTVEVHSRRTGRPPIVLHSVRRGRQFAALLELLAGDPLAPIDADAAAAAMRWEPRTSASRYGEAMAAAAIVVVAALAISLHGSSAAVIYPADDAIYPGGRKQDHDTIVRFMTASVLPWARTTLGPIVGGADRVRCETCHGRDAAARGWRMPGVAALPEPDVRTRGWEDYGVSIDAQMRNAIYGYLAEPEKQTKATYMREVVMPGMAHLLRRQTYDFTRPYAFNRQRAAFGCYHCHKVQSRCAIWPNVTVNGTKLYKLLLHI